ncbi:uncharacterized protein AruCF_2994 [Achromobacter ruhlandii]|uniref:hypothetical protein n=1 Tax=Achromobacter ruhlandii TaxID=72557 RepID=UPI0008655E01|nr:hypothetical protein [Achromobacter ruhlandii]AOU93885.1 uncharacterized protein AruCF_2994 [Achromobacter ruhlandii]
MRLHRLIAVPWRRRAALCAAALAMACTLSACDRPAPPAATATPTPPRTRPAQRRATAPMRRLAVFR